MSISPMDNRGGGVVVGGPADSNRRRLDPLSKLSGPVPSRPRRPMPVFFLPIALVLLVVSVVACGDPNPQKDMPHLGFLSLSASPNFIESLRDGLHDLGYMEGENVNIDWRFTDTDTDLDIIAQEFVARDVDMIIAGGTQAIQAAMNATSTIPIVMTNTGDAVGNGLVKSLARPGGNVTGLTRISPAVSGKQVELLRDTIPGLENIAVLWNPNHPTTPKIFAEIETTAPKLGLTLQSLEVLNPEDLEIAFATASRRGAGAIIAVGDPFTKKYQKRIVTLAERYRIPTMYESKNYLDAGGLMLYGPSFEDLYRRSATYVVKILKGNDPAELPVEQPAKFELVINQQAADRIGLSFPEAILVRADQVIP